MVSLVKREESQDVEGATPSQRIAYWCRYCGHLLRRAASLENTLMLGKIEGGWKGDDRGWDGWMASPTQWTWVWVNSESWWWAGRPRVLQSMGSQRVGHDWAKQQQPFIRSQLSARYVTTCLCTFPNVINTHTCNWRLDTSKQLFLLTISSYDLVSPVLFITFAQSDLYMTDLLLEVLRSSCGEEHNFVIREWIWSSTG